MVLYGNSNKHTLGKVGRIETGSPATAAAPIHGGGLRGTFGQNSSRSSGGTIMNMAVGFAHTSAAELEANGFPRPTSRHCVHRAVHGAFGVYGASRTPVPAISDGDGGLCRFCYRRRARILRVGSGCHHQAHSKKQCASLRCSLRKLQLM